jgi:hypothetical protein
MKPCPSRKKNIKKGGYECPEISTIQKDSKHFRALQDQ